MVAEVIHLYKHGPWYGVSHALPGGGGGEELGGYLLPWQAATRLYIWSLLAKRESITFLALLLSRSIPLSLSFPFILYCLSLACSPPILFIFVICGFDIKVPENINPGWTICSERRDQARAKITLCSPQEVRGKWEKEKRVAEKDRNGGWESWLKLMPHLEKVSK